MLRRQRSFSTTTGRLKTSSLALLVVERDRPAAELVEALERVDEVAEERVAPQLAVGDHVEPGLLLQADRVVDRTVLDPLEPPRASRPAASGSRASEARRAQQAADRVAADGLGG